MKKSEWGRALSFVRQSDRLAKFWKGGKPYEVLDSLVYNIAQLGEEYECFVSRLVTSSDFPDRHCWKEEMTLFAETVLPEFKQKHKKILQAQIIRNVLEAQLPYVLEREKSRGIPPRADIATSKVITNILEDYVDPYPEIKSYQKLSDLEYKVIISLMEGGRPVKLMKQVIELRRALGLKVTRPKIATL